MSIDEALSFYLLQLEADGRSVHTRAQYARHIKLVSRFFPEHKLEELTHVDFARFLTSAIATHRADGRTKKATSMNGLRTSVRAFFGYLNAAGMIPSNPARLVRRAMCGAPLPRALSQEEQGRLLTTLASATGWQAERDHALFHLMLATGVRLSSALALDVEDVDLERGEITLHHAKGDITQRVFLGREIGEHLRRFITGRTGQCH